MDIRSKKDGNEEEIRPPPEVVEFCRIIAGVLRRTHHNSLVDVDCVEKRRQDQFEISELKEYECE